MKKVLFGMLCMYIGAVCGIVCVRRYYKKISDQEIELLREHYKKLGKERMIKEENTVPVESVQITEDVPAQSKDEDIYIIDENDFGDTEDYETITLTYFADGVLADDNDEIIEDVTAAVGESTLEHFEGDIMYVRNRNRECDYEIFRDLRSYSDVGYMEGR